MGSLWIVHRDERLRAALARLAAAPEDALCAAPGDPVLDTSDAPDAVVLGLAGDLEAELELVHRVSARLPHTRWILVAERADLDEARRLFDTLDTELLGYPPEARELRRRLYAGPRRGVAPLPLSQRPARDGLRERFTCWFADLDLPDLLRAVHPRLADVPLLVLGEPGTGRGLLARYVHAFGGTADGVLAVIRCAPDTSLDRIRATLAAESARPRAGAACAVLLENADRLDPALQDELADWIEYGPPEGALRAERVRWLATAGDPVGLSDPLAGELEPRLRAALAGLLLRIPPLRERGRAVAPFANDTARRWCVARGVPPRRFGEDAVLVLEEYPWPGNLRELESVVQQTLVASTSDPLRAGDLRHEGREFAPLGPPISAPRTLPDHPPEPPDLATGLDDDVELALGGLPPDLMEELPEPEAAVELQATPEPPAPLLEAVPLPDLPHTPVTAEAPAEPAPEPPPAEDDESSLRRLAGALAHEVRNPLTSIRSFAALLPERFEDSEFRERFAALASEGVGRIEQVLGRLEQLATLTPPAAEPVDVAALLDELLAQRLERIRQRKLSVLKELETEQPCALGDPDQLRFAFEAIVNKALDLVPERGDVYCASRHHAAGLGGRPGLRVLIRYHGPEPASARRSLAGLDPAEQSVEFLIAEAVVRAHGGAFALDAGETETVVVVDLPAP